MLSPEEIEERRRELESRREAKRQRSRRRLLFYAIVGIIALILAAGTAYITYLRGVSFNSNQQGTASVASGRRNVLLLGVDERAADPGRTDTMILISYDRSGGTVGALSIPRDTRVDIPGHGMGKVNSAYALGGVDLAKQTVSGLLDVPVDYYVTVNFSGFERVVDALGGVEIDVEKPMQYHDAAQDLDIDLQPGVQKLTGEQALHYVRFRADGLGDIALVNPVRGVYDGRVERQLKFLRAVSKQTLRPSVITKLPGLVPRVREAVHTDMPLNLQMQLALSLRDVGMDTLETGLIPGTADTINGVSYWIPDKVKTGLTVNRLVMGGGAKQAVRVAVYNGSGKSGAAAQVAELLRIQGYEVVEVGNADKFDYTHTQVIAGETGKDSADQVAELLRARVRSGTNTATVVSNADLTVIVGQDFQI